MNRVYILGAGASAHAGAPLGNNIIKKYIELKLEQLEKEKKLFSEHGKETFIPPILGNFSTLHHILLIQPNCKFTNISPLEDIMEEDLPNIEDVFTLYDIAYQKDEPLLFEADVDLNIIRKDILDLLTYSNANKTLTIPKIVFKLAYSFGKMTNNIFLQENSIKLLTDNIYSTERIKNYISLPYSLLSE